MVTRMVKSALLATCCGVLLALSGFSAHVAWADGGHASNIYALYYKNGENYTLVLQSEETPGEGYGEYVPKQGGKVTAAIVETSGAKRRGWLSDVDSRVTKVIVRDIIKPSDTFSWFEDMTNCTEMSLAKLDVSNVTDMTSMFAQCKSLKSVDVSGWDTSKVESMAQMFWNCSSLEALDVSRWNTVRVKTTQSMFNSCTSLAALDVSSWNMGSLEKSPLMFKECRSLKTLNLSKWDTPKLSKAWEMFGQCSSLVTFIGNGWRAANLENASAMFIQCSKLKALDLSTLSMARATDLSSLFYGCSALETLNLSGWDTSKAMQNNGLGGFLAQCPRLSLITLGSRTNVGSEMPTPNAKYIPNATGKWVNEAGDVFAPAQVPVSRAATYAAEGSAAAGALVKPKPVPPAVSPTPKPSKISVAKASISVKSKVYNGKAQKCAVPTVKVGGKTLRHKTDFTYSCKAGRAVGSYKVTIAGKGAYAGTKTATFQIAPKGTSISRLVKAKKAFTVKWKKPSKANLQQTTGYQVRWSAAKSMKGAKSKTVKATSAAGKKCTLKVSKLEAKKTYYVQVRTYKKAAGKTYYSSWSKVKTVKVGK
ncbi:BspA family leucine-rich repeat surface protein [Adlercreutzia caecimuris]|uniref:BspA family leucine-rich repeat surface protein n=1 Tax=Adlercreutzia caecimuris TaxID=671266 RepID=UPI00272A10E6|nr:BspA family leucine-rich repeat surface protein [Adlercreutzia caecimuris]